MAGLTQKDHSVLTNVAFGKSFLRRTRFEGETASPSNALVRRNPVTGPGSVSRNARLNSDVENNGPSHRRTIKTDRLPRPSRTFSESIARTDEPGQSSFARPRSFLEEDRCDFAVSRRTLEPSVGRLGRRVFGTTCARAISSFSRARASARLASCVRCTRDVMINTPSCVARLPANARRRCRTSAGSERDWPTSKRSWTAVETLLTFWPPGPEARTKVIVSSESGMNIGKCYFQNNP
jgi:hypothetical protein